MSGIDPESRLLSFYRREADKQRPAGPLHEPGPKGDSIMMNVMLIIVLVFSFAIFVLFAAFWAQADPRADIVITLPIDVPVDICLDCSEIIYAGLFDSQFFRTKDSNDYTRFHKIADEAVYWGNRRFVIVDVNTEELVLVEDTFREGRPRTTPRRKR